MTSADSRAGNIARALIALPDGTAAGQATITSSHETVRLELTVAHISPGAHGVHIHGIGSCSAPGFTGAGPHLNPEGHQHGRSNPAGSHLGDLPNLIVDAAGTGHLAFTLRGSAASIFESLLDADGASIVVHASPDDERTDPSGNSGARVACGVFSRG